MNALAATAWRRLQEATAGAASGIATPAAAADGTGSSSSSSSINTNTTANKAEEPGNTGGGGHVAFFVGMLVLLGALLAWWLWRLNRWRYNRSHQLKVLDEIEMEFVNDDMDTDVMEDHAASGLRCAHARPGARSSAALRAGVDAHGGRLTAARGVSVSFGLCSHLCTCAALSCAVRIAVEG